MAVEAAPDAPLAAVEAAPDAPSVREGGQNSVRIHLGGHAAKQRAHQKGQRKQLQKLHRWQTTRHRRRLLVMVNNVSRSRAR